MMLNNHSYGHIQVRKLCKLLETSTNMVLVSDLGKEFDEIRFLGKFGYIIINYKNEACFTLGIHLTNQEWECIREIIIYLQFFDFGRKYEEQRKRREKHEK